MAEPIILHGNTKDLTGNVFGRLTVCAPERFGGRLMWRCRCSCGAITSARPSRLLSGRTRSCGCLQRDTRIKHGHGGAGDARRSEYRIWDAMIQRCVNPRNRYYPMYGGRGIVVCERWRNYLHFIADMGPRPHGHSIERIDNDGGYCPENCRWATRFEQQRNRRNNVLVTFDGETMCSVDWDIRRGFPKGIVRGRILLGWTPERAITTPYKQRR